MFHSSYNIARFPVTYSFLILRCNLRFFQFLKVYPETPDRLLHKSYNTALTVKSTFYASL